jgi:hypothetical protein
VPLTLKLVLSLRLTMRPTGHRELWGARLRRKIDCEACGTLKHRPVTALREHKPVKRRMHRVACRNGALRSSARVLLSVSMSTDKQIDGELYRRETARTSAVLRKCWITGAGVFQLKGGLLCNS